MHLPVHLFHPKAPTPPRLAETISFPSAIDVTWNRPVFRAPHLATLHPFGPEIPFVARQAPKFTARKNSA